MIVTVKFKGSGSVYAGDEYYYRTDIPVAIGEEVVVNTPTGLTVAMVYRKPDLYAITNIEDIKEYIVQRIDKRHYNELMQKQKEHQRAKIAEALDKRIEYFQKTKFAEILSKDEEFVRLLLEYRKLL